MKIILEPTSQITEITDFKTGIAVPARLWVGRTATGIPVQALITRIAAPGKYNQADFQRDLIEQRAPTPLHVAYALTLML